MARDVAGGLASVRPAMLAGPARPRVRVRPGQLALAVLTGAVLVFLILPSLLVIPMSLGTEKYLEFPPRSLSFGWYRAYFSDPDWVGPTLFSLQIALLTAVVSTVVGTMAALALVRGRLPGRDWLQGLIVAPMIVPHIIVAIGIYSFFARLHLTGTMLGFVLAHTVLAVPYVVLTVSAALARFDASLELAALSLGASRLAVALRVTVPLVLPGVLTGAAFAFISSFDEAVVSFFISGVTGKTLPRKLFEDIDFDVSPVVAAVATLLTLLSLVVMGGIELARRRTRGRAAGGDPRPVVNDGNGGRSKRMRCASRTASSRRS